MPEVDKNAPIRRGPGRPRKIQESDPEPKRPSDPADPRIGESVEDGVKWISFADGSEYRCADGVITERAT